MQYVRVREMVLLAVGILMLCYETVAGGDRLYIIMAAVTLCGLPVALLSDRLRRNGDH
jgi:hypothetical protein